MIDFSKVSPGPWEVDVNSTMLVNGIEIVIQAVLSSRFDRLARVGEPSASQIESLRYAAMLANAEDVMMRRGCYCVAIECANGTLGWAVRNKDGSYVEWSFARNHPSGGIFDRPCLALVAYDEWCKENMDRTPE